MAVNPIISSATDVFTTTIAGLEDAFRVRHIATFHLYTCAEDEPVESVPERYPDFDYVPVRDAQGCIVGVLDTDLRSGALVRDHAQRLDDSILVSADESLARFLPLMSEHRFYRLVVDGTQISGIVTRSDALKLPVRLFAFARITHLEMLMMRIIQARYPRDDDWLAHLAKDKGDKVKKDRKRLKKDRDDPPLIEFTGLWEKALIIQDTYKFDDSYQREMSRITEIRHLLAHAGDFAESTNRLSDFLARIDLAESWIVKLTQLVHNSATPSSRYTESDRSF